MHRYEGQGYRLGTTASPPIPFISSGVELMSWMPLTELDVFFDNNVQAANDMWGYTSPSGREYAIMGVSEGVVFIEVTDPTQPQVVNAYQAEEVSTWRDMKTYQQFAYVVSDEGDQGLWVFDLRDIDAGSVHLISFYDVGDNHNVAVDVQSGYLYLSGIGNGSLPGMSIYDLETPAEPRFLTKWGQSAVHDLQVVTYTSGSHQGRQVAFLFTNEVGATADDEPIWVNHELVIVDVTDKQNIQELSRLPYSNAAFSHQGWLSSNMQYLYLTDEADEATGENPNTTTRIIQVQDLSNPAEIGTFTNGNTSIDHNLYTHNDMIFAANYTSGLRIFDATNPVAPVEIAYFDTHPENDEPLFEGLWTSYPYFPSGTIIGSDIQKGLFAWRLEMATQQEEDLDSGGGCNSSHTEQKPNGFLWVFIVLLAMLHNQHFCGMIQVLRREQIRHIMQ